MSDQDFKQVERRECNGCGILTTPLPRLMYLRNSSQYELTVTELRDRYHEVFGEDTNARNKQWLIKRIAWKLQANAEGDISERARQLAHQIALETDIRTSLPRVTRQATTETLETVSTTISPPADDRIPLPGAALVKTYKGRSIQVMVRPNSFEFEGTQYKTLTAIARVVTGQKNINGIQFFGLRKAQVAQ